MLHLRAKAAKQSLGRERHTPPRVFAQLPSPPPWIHPMNVAYHPLAGRLLIGLPAHCLHFRPKLA
jgi:hypothetical protein